MKVLSRMLHHRTLNIYGNADAPAEGAAAAAAPKTAPEHPTRHFSLPTAKPTKMTSPATGAAEDSKDEMPSLVKVESSSMSAVEEKISSGENNKSGGDDVIPENRRKRYVISKEELVLDSRYTPSKKLGMGSSGIVVSAYDSETENKEMVAIKKVRDYMQEVLVGRRVLREIKLMQYFEHDNVVKLKDIINPVGKREAEDIYMVMEYMKSDLHKIIVSNNELTQEHIAYIVFQILCGVRYIHSAKVIHRDLKPNNILINADCRIKIADLGLARGMHVDSDDEIDLTEYVVTRWYRAPEVVVSAKHYDYAIDVWSIGCILAELFLRCPLFPGNNSIHQLQEIFAVIGTPTEEDIGCILDENSLKFVKNLKHENPKDWADVLPNVPEAARDLISKMLVFNPKQRITIDEALRHPFFAPVYDQAAVDGSICEEPFTFEFEKLTRTKETVQDSVFREIVRFRPFAAGKNPLSRRGSGKNVLLRRSVTESDKYQAQ
eukprot:TRINITY_DN1173_c0_g1_i1.p1 TRINITY_DN1173_c0_g1~~TRINITY_DN1173_c0_g1_i1.p1  ORF type:complete len:491 (-),score=127.20 TRINITY_DN1173_c0_g1_i1:112-1584(-)